MSLFYVIPAKAGIQCFQSLTNFLDPGFHSALSGTEIQFFHTFGEGKGGGGGNGSDDRRAGVPVPGSDGATSVPLGSVSRSQTSRIQGGLADIGSRGFEIDVSREVERSRWTAANGWDKITLVEDDEP